MGRGVLTLPVPPAPSKKQPRQLVEFAGGIVTAASVAIAGEIHEVERRAASSRDAIDVREPGLSRGRAGARDLLSDRRIDQARLPDIRTAHEGNFRQAVAGEIGRPGAARDEGGGNFQSSG